MELLIIRGAVQFRLDPVLPVPTGTPLRLDEPLRRTVEVARANNDAYIFNHWHETVPLLPVDRHLLPMLDGTRDRDALVEELLSIAKPGVICFARDGMQLSQMRRNCAQLPPSTSTRCRDAWPR